MLYDRYEQSNTAKKDKQSIVVDGKPIEVIARLPEPAAVAIDYLFYMQNLSSQKDKFKSDVFTALIYDLGHGTFDTAVVTARSDGSPYSLHFNDGIPDVGG